MDIKNLVVSLATLAKVRVTEYGGCDFKGLG